MKRLKKILALALAMAMVVAMALPAMAASITVNETETDTHEYKVYQIFTGTLDAKTGTLADLKYGANYKTAGTAVPKSETDAIDGLSGDKAREFATLLLDGNAANGEVTGSPIGVLNKSNSFTLNAVGENALPDGYYLIVDDTDKTLGKGDMFSKYIVQVSGDTVIAPKKSTVEEHKKITADDHDAASETEGTGEDISTDKTADDLSIGEDVTFTIDATVPLAAADYDKFFFVINDTLSEGLTLKTDSFKVYTMEGETKTDLAAEKYTKFVKGDTTNPADNGKTFQIALKDAKSLAGKTIYVEYKATLNEKAKVGENPNTNKTTVTYSNQPDHKYQPDDTNNDGKPDDGKNPPTGETPEQETKTFTASIELKKTDENGNVLTGAEFKIAGTSVKKVLVTSDVYTAADDGTYYKLKNGTYTTAAPGETDSYQSKGTAATESGYVLDTTTNQYRVGTYDELKDTTIEKFTKITANKDDYESTTQKYKKEKKSELKDTTSSVEAKAFVDADGYVRFDGLGSGEYTITETTVPAGYNAIDPIKVVISFDNTDGDKDTTNNSTDDDSLVWSATSEFVKNDTDNKNGTIQEVDAHGTSGDGVIKTFAITVKNQKGNTLPETGGIGTTIFYVVGAILVIGAGVVLITRRRMEA